MKTETWTGWNIGNLQKLRDAVAFHGPEHFNMYYWFHTPEEGSMGISDAGVINIKQCGTTACLAGHAVLLIGGSPFEDDVVKWLGLPNNHLFRQELWPEFIAMDLEGRLEILDGHNTEHEDALALLDEIIAYAKEQKRKPWK